MRIILLSGGSGKRLWPLSNDTRSKQFLKILPAEDGTRISMVQRVWRQLQSLNLHHSTIISTSESQQDMIRMQLSPKLPLVLEPQRRDTFPAIALACAYLHTVEQVNPQESVIVMPVDSYVEDAFFHKLMQLPAMLEQTKSNLALIGVKPNHPSEKYGYIVPHHHQSPIGPMRVQRFVEKPPTTVADQLIQEGALWNCGVFAFRIQYLLSLMEERGLPVQFDELQAQYDDLPSRSFDYEVVEREPNVAVIRYEGDWKDLGTWSTITEEMADPIYGEGYISEDSSRTVLFNELGIPVVVLGVQDAVVAASPEGILVSNKEASVRLKDMIKSIPPDRPRYLETTYGWSCVVDKVNIRPNVEAVTRRIHIMTGESICHTSTDDCEWIVWTIVSGIGTIHLDGVEKSVQVGAIITLHDANAVMLIAESNLNLIEIRHEHRHRHRGE